MLNTRQFSSYGGYVLLRGRLLEAGCLFELLGHAPSRDGCYSFQVDGVKL